MLSPSCEVVHCALEYSSETHTYHHYNDFNTRRESRCRCWTRARQRGPSLPQTNSAGTCPCFRSSSRDPGRALAHQAASTFAQYFGVRVLVCFQRTWAQSGLAPYSSWPTLRIGCGQEAYFTVSCSSGLWLLEKIVLHHSDSSWAWVWEPGGGGFERLAGACTPRSQVWLEALALLLTGSRLRPGGAESTEAPREKALRLWVGESGHSLWRAYRDLAVADISGVAVPTWQLSLRFMLVHILGA